MINIKKHVLVIQIIMLVINVICFILLILALQEVRIGNLKFYKRSETINLDNISNVDITEISTKIDKFYHLKQVDFGSNNIHKDEKAFLESEYPDIIFKANLVIDLYGEKVRDNVTYLDLSKAKIDDALVDNLANFPYLEEVNLFNQDLSLEQMLSLKGVYPNVDFLFTIKHDGKKVASTVEDLDLKGTKLSYEEINKMLKLFPNLKTVDLSYSKLTNEECNNLRKAHPDLEINWVIYLGKWSLRTDATAFSVLITTFDYRRMTSKDIEVLKYCTKLKALDLGHQAITDISVIGEYLPDLRILILADNKISDISPIAKLKKLHYLELFINPIKDISPLKENKELVDLNLANLPQVRDITPILNLPKLERLMVNNIGAGWNGITKIRETYPNIMMVTTGNQSTHGGWRSHPRYFQMIDMFYNNYYGDEFAKYD